MTTPEAATRYANEHARVWNDRQYVVYNPHNKPVEELPTIYGFNNGGSDGWFTAMALAEDGTELGGHVCSAESYMLHDLGIVDGARPDRHDTYREHYPDGYKMDFVPYKNVRDHAKLMEAIEKANAKG